MCLSHKALPVYSRYVTHRDLCAYPPWISDNVSVGITIHILKQVLHTGCTSGVNGQGCNSDDLN